MPAKAFGKIDAIAFLGQIVDGKSSGNKSAEKKAERFAKAIKKSAKAVEKDKTRYGGGFNPWFKKKTN